MKGKKKDNRRYLNLLLILFGVVLMTIGSSNIYKNRQENKINNSYLSKVIANIQYNELENARLEFSPDTFLYISYTGDSNIHSLEVQLKKILDNHDLVSNMIYLNAGELMDEEDYLAKINEKLDLQNSKIKSLPAIVYFKDNKDIEVLDSSPTMFNASNFYQLLEKYELIN